MRQHQSAHPPKAGPETKAFLPGLDLESDPGNREPIRGSGVGLDLVWTAGARAHWTPKELDEMCFRERKGAGHEAISITHVPWRLPQASTPYDSGLRMVSTEWGGLGSPSLRSGETQAGKEGGLVLGQERDCPAVPMWNRLLHPWLQ